MSCNLFYYAYDFFIYMDGSPGDSSEITYGYLKLLLMEWILSGC